VLPGPTANHRHWEDERSLQKPGKQNEKIAQYQAGALEQRVLHMQTADPLRTPTYSIFPVPDYFFGTSGPNISINPNFAYDHGYYSPNIDVTWAAFTGPGPTLTWPHGTCGCTWTPIMARMS